MIYPSEKEFLTLTKKGNLIPIYEEILGDLETPVSAYLKLAHQSKYAILLESVEGGEKVCRYSFLAKDPEFVFKSKGNQAQIITFTSGKEKTKKYPMSQTPLDEIKKIMSQYIFVNVKGLPKFCGGFIGYMGYDTVRFFENLPDKPKDDLKLEDMILALVKDLVIFDHLNHKIKIVSCANIIPEASMAQKRLAYKKAQKNIAKTILSLKSNIPHAQATKTNRKPIKLKVSSNFTEKQFKSAVIAAKQHILAGDIIQVVLSQRFTTQISTDPLNVYRALRTVNPSPYMYLLHFDDIYITGSSPELLVRCENNIVETRPIAGTRPRGKDEKDDFLLAKELLSDPKEKAEHIMLVDLGRNDLGRVCQQGSVKVSEFMNIEHYSHVMHIVSNVKGDLEKNKTPFDVLQAAFPAGTVSGAPKIRAMEIIDRLEPVARGPYAGAIGYLGFAQNLDTCITIRTIVIKNKKAYVQAGAGIVADSNPSKEYLETKNKAQALLSAIAMAHNNFT
jgi:anthranilate synthase component 1